MLKYMESEKRQSNPLALDDDQSRELEEMIARLKSDIIFAKKEGNKKVLRINPERGTQRGGAATKPGSLAQTQARKETRRKNRDGAAGLIGDTIPVVFPIKSLIGTFFQGQLFDAKKAKAKFIKNLINTSHHCRCMRNQDDISRF